MNLYKISSINFKIQINGCILPVRYLSYLSTMRIEKARKFNNNLPKVYFSKRQYSLRASLESFAKTQAGFFKTLSESTPVEYIQKFLITVHDITGLPWWSSIVISTIIFRSCITLPLAVYQQYILAKVENLKLEMKSVIEEIKKEMALAIKLYKWDERTAMYNYRRSVKKQWDNLIVRENCHPFKASLLMIVQFPLWICFSVSLRNFLYMLPDFDLRAKLIYSQLSSEGFGWISNLTLTDPTYLLPIFLGISSLAIVEVNTLGRKKTPSKIQNIITNMFRGFSIIIIPVSACLPSCLLLYWTTSTVFGLVQNLVLLSPKVRRFCRIPQTESELTNPYSHILKEITNRKYFIISPKIKSEQNKQI